jgi:methyl-accepting chemotaxis protein
MADSKRQLLLELLSRNKMSKDVKDAADDLDHLADSAEDANKSSEKLGHSTEVLGSKAEEMGKKTERTKVHIASLQGEIKNTEKELGSLAESFAAAGTKAERVDISKAIRRTENDLRKLSKSKGLLENLLPDPEPKGRSFGQKLSQGITSGLASAADAAGPLKTYAAAAVGVAAPVLAGGIEAAITAGIGAGFIGGGALLLKDDAQISGWAKRIGTNFKGALTASAKDALEVPFLASLGKVESFSQRTAATMGKAFQDVAPYVDHLTDSLINSGDALVGSLGRAASKSGPALDGLGDSVVLLTTGVSSFIDEMASGGPAAADNLRLIAGAMGDVIAQTGTFLSFLNKVSDNAWITGPLLPLLKDHYRDSADAANQATNSTDEFASAQDEAAAAAQRHDSAVKRLTDSLKAQTDPAFALLNAQDGVKEAQDRAAAATKKYGAKSDEARTATRQLAEAAITLQGAASSAGGMIDGHLSPAMYATLKAAKLTKSQIHDVESQLRRAQKAASDYAGNYRANITTTFYTKYVGKYYSSANEAERDMGRRASGGSVTRGTPYVVGEQGTEVFVPDTNGRIMSAAASRGSAAASARTMSSAPGAVGTMGRPMGGSVVRGLQVEVIGNDPKLISLLKYLIRTGNVIEG